MRARIRSLAGRTAPPRPSILGAADAGTLADRDLRLLAALDVRPGRVTARARLDVVLDDPDDVDDALAAVRARLRRHGCDLVELAAGDVLLVRSAPS